jgi:hypothetical protein
LIQYYEKTFRGTESEDMKVIVQFLVGMIGQKFSFLNYYKEIPVSYDATLLSIENGMAEFSVHEYQAKVINIERRVLIYSHAMNPFPEDMIGEAFYVNTKEAGYPLRIRICAYQFLHAPFRKGLA